MNCVECEHPMRSSKARIQDHPGTRRHGGKGRCMSCYMAARRLAQAPVVEDFDERLARVALDGYLAERRRRLARA